MKAVTAQEMREIERRAMEETGIPGVVLMENAGRAIAEIARSWLRRNAAPDSEIGVFCGGGNNGGDGLVAARHLFNSGYDVTVVMTESADRLKGDALTNYRIVTGMGIPVMPFSPQLPAQRYKLIIDALLGIGLQGEVRQKYRDAIEWINASTAAVIAADIPSGLDADDGNVHGAAVRADVTVTMGYAKKGLLVPTAVTYTGEIVVADIALPRSGA
jgi:NAD(P)H-hydrate epimerase